MQYKKIIMLGMLAITPLIAQKPKLTLVMIVDQFAYHELQKLKPYLTGGIGYMLNNGIVYEQCVMPHGYPQTAPGHASHATGTLPKDHGIICNRWYDKEGNYIASDFDPDTEASAVFARKGFHKTGKSSKNMLVDTLSDQFVLRSSPQKRYEAIALSLKSRSAIAMAGKAGTAFWLDSHSGWFTSSKAYVPALPNWVTTFNKKNKIHTLKSVHWDLAYPAKSPAYQFNNINNYEFAGSWGLIKHAERVAGTTIDLAVHNKENSADYGNYEMLAKTPIGNKLLTDFAKACIDTHIDYKKTDHLLLWVSFSGLDKVGHPYGPESLETIDMLYHTDKQIQVLIDYAIKRFGQRNVLCAISADHGIMPIPELAHADGYSAARRILAEDLVSQINKHLAKKLNISNGILHCSSNNLYLNHKIFDALPKDRQSQMLQETKQFVSTIPGIKRAWTYDELAHSNYQLELGDLEAFYSNQLIPGRSGEIILQVLPYTLISDAETGITHTTPYDYDTHIPLILCQKGSLKPQRITERVFAQQLAPSLAYLLDVPRPSASTFQLLPGITKK